jgi:stage II sporulation protein D
MVAYPSSDCGGIYGRRYQPQLVRPAGVRPLVSRRRLIPSLCLLAAAVTVADAHAASSDGTLVIRGRGYGHGVGMSQWGAYGYAVRGWDHKAILAHYFTGTAIGDGSGSADVRVLLAAGRARATFTQATSAGGRPLDPAKTYSVTSDGLNGTVLRSPAGRSLSRTAGALRITGGTTPVLLRGRSGSGVTDGQYRGAIDVSASVVRGVDVINAVGLEDYVRGVVAAESPSTWPAAALQAQAVAARTYAITTDAGTSADGFTQYADTRSQVYQGVAGETPATDTAVTATRGEVVTYAGKPVATYFFSTSGGKTENVENSFLGARPQPWLTSVDDPYDDASPKHSWGPLRFTRAQANRRLKGLVKGSFRSIDVTRRGASPRVVQALVIGTRGSTPVDGPALRKRFGLFDTWATFTTIGAKVQPQDTATTAPKAPGTPSTDPSGGAQAGGAAVARRRAQVLSGTITPGRRGGWVEVQRRADGPAPGWTTVAWATTDRRGRYRVTLPGPGTYRPLWGGAPGPELRAG